MRAALGRRVVAVRSHVPVGCTACRTHPPLAVLWPEDPKPATACQAWGRAVTGTTWVRFVQLDRGPA